MNDVQVKGIDTPHVHENDVLFSRSTFVNSHPGNRKFINYVHAQRKDYAATNIFKKPYFVKLIVETIQNLILPSGRFLKQDEKTKLWHEISDKRAWKKTRKVLKEKLPNLSDSTSPPTVKSKFMSKGTPTTVPTALSSLDNDHSLRAPTTNDLRQMLVRQLSVTVLDQSTEQWLTENDISVPISLDGGNEVSDSCINDRSPKQSFTQGNRRSSLKYDRRKRGSITSILIKEILEETQEKNDSKSNPISDRDQCDIITMGKISESSNTNTHNNSLLLDGISGGRENEVCLRETFKNGNNCDSLSNLLIGGISGRQGKTPDLKSIPILDRDSCDIIPKSAILDPPNTNVDNNGLLLEDLRCLDRNALNNSSNSLFLEELVPPNLREIDIGPTDAISVLTGPGDGRLNSNATSSYTLPIKSEKKQIIDDNELAELEDWQQEAREWEREAEIEDKEQCDEVH